jgi:hypothetical protein
LANDSSVETVGNLFTAMPTMSLLKHPTVYQTVLIIHPLSDGVFDRLLDNEDVDFSPSSKPTAVSFQMLLLRLGKCPQRPKGFSRTTPF